MSSLNNMKSKYYKTGMDTHLAVTLSDEDTVGCLLVNNDFDTLDMPEIITKPQVFNSHEHLVDIYTVDDFQDSPLILESLVEKSPASRIEPTAGVNAKNPASTTPPPELETFATTIEDDRPDKIIIAPLDNPYTSNSVGTISSLVQNNTKVEKNSLNEEYIPNNVTVKNTELQLKHTAYDKAIQASATFTTTADESLHASEWALFKTEQNNLNSQYLKRILALEKSLRKAMLFSIISALLAGLSLIAVVSGLV